MPENKELTSSLWNLESKLQIPIWNDPLSIPNPGFDYSDSQIQLQKDLGFIFIPNRLKDKSGFDVFLSTKTDLESLFQCLPFIFEEYRLFLCEQELISDRLAFLDNRESFIAENRTTQALSSLLEKAIVKNASDIHLESMSHEKIVRFRINGQLIVQNTDELINEALFSKIKLISKMDISKSRQPQDGQFQFTSKTGVRYDMRTATAPGVFGEKIVIRLLPTSTVKLTLEALGFPSQYLSIIRKTIKQKSGMILFTGPTGSGKTTSLYAILHELIKEPINIMTIEDPVEYRINSITQVEVNELAGITFSSSLRAFLRLDPDVILVGEIRDSETAQIAARASQTGHLVLSTLHSNDVFESLRRLKNLGIENDDLAGSLKLIVSQRLVPRRCGCDAGRAEIGCEKCNNTGIDGRIPILEILETSKNLKKMIAEGENEHQIKKAAEKSGFFSLKQYATELVGQKVIREDDWQYFFQEDEN